MLYEVARAYGLTFEPRLSFAAADEAVGAATAAGQTPIAWLARLERSFAHQLVDPHGKPTQEIRDELAAATAALEEAGDEAALATVWRRRAEIEWMPCRFDTAAEAADRAVDHARRAGERPLLVHAMGIRMAAEMFGTMRPDEMLASLEAATEEIGQEGLFGQIALVHRSVIAAMKRDLNRARRLSGDAIALAERMGVGFFVAAAYEFRADFELQTGDAVAAEGAFRKQYQILDRLGDEGHKSFAAGGLAHALCALGRVDEAETFAPEAVEAAAEDDVSSQAMGRSALAAVHSLRGQHEEAIRLAREAAEMFASAESPNFQGDMSMTVARVLREAGQTGEAADAARAALTLYERKGNGLAAESARAFIASLPVG
jgi:tetratricopeptide (TPR) repeat protein